MSFVRDKDVVLVVLCILCCVFRDIISRFTHRLVDMFRGR